MVNVAGVQFNTHTGSGKGATAVRKVVVDLTVVEHDVLCSALDQQPPSSRSAVPPAEDDLRLRVNGMGCTACSVKVRAALECVDGVSACTVAFEEGCAQLQLDSSGFGTAEERAAVEERAIAALAKPGRL